jgi:hypothetical protein
VSETRDDLTHLDVNSTWCDREGDTWRYVESVGWTWSRDGGGLRDSVLDEPAVPLPCDGPFIEVLP